MHGGANSQRADESMYAVKVSHKEGGAWVDCPEHISKEYVNCLAFGISWPEPYIAFKFPDGTIWDRIVGWRPENPLMRAIKFSNAPWEEVREFSDPVVKAPTKLDVHELPVGSSESYKLYYFPDDTYWISTSGWHKNEVAQSAAMRQFATGATRNLDEHQLDYEAFLSPLVLEEYAKYMHGKRKQADGSMRDGDNWQKGIPFDSYMKSGFRHFMDWWKTHRSGYLNQERTALYKEILCAVMFNAMGYLHEVLQKEKELSE